MTDQVKDAIEKGIAEKLGDEVSGVQVAFSIHTSFVRDELATRITALVPGVAITIVKYASRMDTLKAAMPYFIRRIFPPKTVEVTEIIGLPGIKGLKEYKVAALIYYTNELLEYPDALIKWCVECGVAGLRKLYTNRTFNGF